MTLREAVEAVLRESGHPMRSREIAQRIADGALYVRRDGSPVPPSDVNVTANDNKHIFDVDRGLISLHEGPGPRRATAPQSATPSAVTPPTWQPVPSPVAPAPRGVARLIAESFWTGLLDVSERRGAPTPDWTGLPELRGAGAIRDRGASDADVRMWVTFIAAMDRARDADALWAAGAQLHAAQPWVFDPAAVAAASFGALVDVLRESGVSQRHGPDAAAWRLIAETLAVPAVAPAVHAAIWDGAGDAETLRNELQQATPAGTARFPALRGPKIGPMWIRMLVVPGNAVIARMKSVPVAVDVQVRRVTEHLGVARTADVKLEQARAVIQAAWTAEVSAHGAPGPAGLTDTPAALDPALWFWGKWGCSHCEGVGGRRPIGPACAGCDLAP